MNKTIPTNILEAASSLVAPYGGRIVFPTPKEKESPSGGDITDKRGYLNTMDACRYLHVCPTTFYKLLKRTGVTSSKVFGTNRNRYLVADLDSMLVSSPAAVGEEA